MSPAVTSLPVATFGRARRHQTPPRVAPPALKGPLRPAGNEALPLKTLRVSPECPQVSPPCWLPASANPGSPEPLPELLLQPPKAPQDLQEEGGQQQGPPSRPSGCPQSVPRYPLPTHSHPQAVPNPAPSFSSCFQGPLRTYGRGGPAVVPPPRNVPRCPSLTATVILPRILSGIGPWILFFSFSAQVPISSMAMKTSV